MKSFDLEAAKSGAPIVTRDGREARFIAHVPEFDEEYRVIVQISGKGGAVSYCEDGSAYKGCEDHDDLFMKPQKRTVWVNLYKDGKAFWHEHKKTADDYASQTTLLAAVPIEIEE